MRIIILGTRKSVLAALLTKAKLLEVAPEKSYARMAQDIDEVRAEAFKESLDKLRGDWNGRRK